RRSHRGEELDEEDLLGLTAKGPATATVAGPFAVRQPAVSCRRFAAAPPTRPVRRVGDGIGTGALGSRAGSALVIRSASAGHMSTACCASFSSHSGTGMFSMTG